MLLPAPSQTLNQEQLAVIYDHNPTALLATLARLILARDPYGMLPPQAVRVDLLARLAINPIVLGDSHANIIKQAQAPREKSASFIEATEPFAAVLSLSQWLAIGPAISMPRGFLFRAPPASDANVVPNASKDAALRAALELATCDETQSGSWLNEDNITNLATLTLWCSFEKIKSASYYSGAIEVPSGASKERYAEAVRARRILALLTVLRQSISLAPLREMAAFFQSPIVQPFLEYAGGTTKDEVSAYATKLLSLKVHPWVAEAERMRLTARRYTEWSASSVTIGLTREGLFKRIAARASMRGKDSAVQQDARMFVLDELIKPFLDEARETLILREMMEPGDVTQAESALGLTSPGSAPQLHLHGQSWKALIMTGDAASEALSDLLTLLTRPLFPLKTEGDTMATNSMELAGNVDAFNYDAATWENGLNGLAIAHPLLQKPTNQPLLFVEPERPIAAEGHTLYQITPEMLRPMVPGEYFGDEDITEAEYTRDAAARLLGYNSFNELSPPVRDRLSDPDTGIFIAEAKAGSAQGGWVPRYPTASRIFHSARTRKPWLKKVALGKAGMPTQVIALNARTAPLIRHIAAVVIRTPDRPVLSAATQAFSDDQARKALTALGAQAQ
jgi:hypothetical protein